MLLYTKHAIVIFLLGKMFLCEYKAETIKTLANSPKPFSCGQPLKITVKSSQSQKEKKSFEKKSETLIIY